MTLPLIDLVAAIAVVAGFNIAFRQRAVRSRLTRHRSDRLDRQENDLDGAMRIGGVMLMAFAGTICAFANLIAHYASAS